MSSNLDMSGNPYMKIPKESECQAMAESFKNKWNLPNCVGAIDGKHIAFQAPPNSGTSTTKEHFL